MKRAKIEQGESIIDLSIGAPNIPPTRPVMEALAQAALAPENYLYALGDQPRMLEAVRDWYSRRYGVALDAGTEICSLLARRKGSRILRCRLSIRAILYWHRTPATLFLPMARGWPGRKSTICRRKKKMTISSSCLKYRKL